MCDCERAPEGENWPPGFLADHPGRLLCREQPWQVVAFLESGEARLASELPLPVTPENGAGSFTGGTFCATALTQQFRFAECLSVCLLTDSAGWFWESGQARMVVSVCRRRN